MSEVTHSDSGIGRHLHTRAGDTPQHGAGNYGIPPQGSGSTSKPIRSEKLTKGRDSQYRENCQEKYLRSLFMEPAILAYYGVLAVPANLWRVRS
jgi:hypothetical protein